MLKKIKKLTQQNIDLIRPDRIIITIKIQTEFRSKNIEK